MISKDLGAMLRGVRDFGLEDGMALEEATPVSHATDSYMKRRLRIRSGYGKVWDVERARVEAPTP